MKDEGDLGQHGTYLLLASQHSATNLNIEQGLFVVSWSVFVWEIGKQPLV